MVAGAVVQGLGKILDVLAQSLNFSVLAVQHPAMEPKQAYLRGEYHHQSRLNPSRLPGLW